MVGVPFELREPDRDLSPVTGMVRAHWIAAGHYLMQRYRGLFDEDRQEFMPPAPADRDDLAGRFELFTRMMLLILPMARVDRETRVAGMAVELFLENSLRRYCDPASPDWIGLPGPGKSPYQLVQWAGLVVALFHGPTGLWEALPRRVRQQSLENLAACVDHRTNAHNWRYFNVLGAAFLDSCGVSVDAAAEEEHLEQLLAWYAGDGWYRDGQDFDYYNAWAFQTYAALWSSLSRSRRYPEIRRQLLSNFGTFMETYPRMFSRDGRSLLWGRSAVYRFAACAPLSAAFSLPDPSIRGGVARRICSGNIMQFLGRADLWDGSAPTRGFYREFPPIVQYYSRSSSFGWMHKAFLCLSLPPDNPFWTDREEEGPWWREPSLAGQNGPWDESVSSVSLTRPGMVISNDRSVGDVVLRTGKVRAATDPCYGRLAYFGNDLLEGPTAEPPTSLAYEATSDAHGVCPRLSVSRIRYGGCEGEVLYRQVYLGPVDGHHSEGILIDLADVAVPGGILRIDRVRSSFPHILWLGGFSVPGHLDLSGIGSGEVARYEVDPEAGGAVSTLVPLMGWDGAVVAHRRETHAEYPVSTTPGLFRRVSEGASGSLVIVSALITRGRPSPDGVPAVTPTFRDPGNASGIAPTGADVRYPSGSGFSVSFDGIEGRLQD